MERKSVSSHDTAVPVGCEFKRRQAEEGSLEIPDHFSPLRTFAQLFNFQCFQLPYQPEKFALAIDGIFFNGRLKNLVASGLAFIC